tara:strand:- start:183 stop:467 length:285 start_codon:yes stop_codon:yes gene_type:complete
MIEMLLAIFLLWILSSLSFIAASFFLSSATGNPEGLQEALWGIALLITGIILAILSVILMIIKSYNGNTKKQIARESNPEKDIVIPDPVIHIED